MKRPNLSPLPSPVLARSRPVRLLLALAALWGFALADGAAAADKNGVSPQAISLPTGPGSIQGLGESFQPQLNTGSGSYAVKLELPSGTAGHTPDSTLRYDTGSPNGVLGLGWSLSGLGAVARNLDEGLPLYVDGANGVDDDLDGAIDNPQELDAFSGMDGEELVPLADGSFRAENEASFLRYTRAGAGWEARSKDGTRYEFGKSSSAQIEDGGRVFRWLVERVTDLDGNLIEFFYGSDAGSPGQKYCRSIRWGRPEAYFGAALRYESGRPDVFSDFRSGFEVRTALRLAGIDVFSHGVPSLPGALEGDFDDNGRRDALIRRYEFDYHDDVHLSLLKSVTKLGRDGATALPPASFEYSRWTAPDNVAAAIINDGGAPPEGLSSASVEIIDMNGDGLPDILSTAASEHRVQIHRGQQGSRLVFGASEPVDNAPTIDIASTKTHLADSTADGAADLLLRAAVDRFFCYDNTSQKGWTTPTSPLRKTTTWPLWPFDGAEGVNSRSLDCDHNRANDILHTGASGLQLWLFLRNGQYSAELRRGPLTFEGQTFRFELPGPHVADINADRLQDVVWVQSSRLIYWLNEGRGNFGEPVSMSLSLSLSAADIEKAGFSDLDGDGMVDLTVVRPSTLPQGIFYWLNRFQSGLVGPKRITGLPAQSAGDALRWADMNGNGSSDILISNSQRPAGQRLAVIDLVPGVRPYVLTHIDNGLGLTVAMTYESSIDQMVRAERPWSFTMPMSVPVLARIAEDDGRGTVNSRNITYRDPYYDAEKQEFRGFREAELRELGDDSIETQATFHRYDTGESSDCLKGKLIETVVTDEAGSVVERTENLWSNRILEQGIDLRPVCYAVTERVESFILERGDAPVHVRSELRFDDFGNEVESRDHGVLQVAGDEVFTTREFELRPDVWLMGLKVRETVTDKSGRIASDDFFQYDARGRLTRHEAWLDTENRNVVVARMSYDGFGNLVETIDADGRRRTIEYDPWIHAHPVAERVHRGDGSALEMLAEHDLGLGAIVRATDFSGAEYRAGYDALGRLERLELPGGALRTYEYHLGSPVSFVAEKRLESPGGGTLDSFTYSDGYGRKLGTKVEAEGGRWRFLDAVRYNSRKLATKSWLPHETAGPNYEEPADALPHETHRYDVKARPAETVHPDGSSTRIEYEPLVSRHFDENDDAGQPTPQTVRRDGLGRILEVVERNGAESYSTSYRWNTLGLLTEIRDAQGNSKTMTYDSLRRRIAMSDPDRGLTRYAYDDADDHVRTTDAKGQVIEYEYDFAKRLKRELHRAVQGGPAKEVLYVFDAPSAGLDLGNGETASAAFTAGRLAAVFDGSGETHFSYDERGNQVWTLKRIQEPASGLLVSYLTRFSFDLEDRLTELVYPDEDRVRYAYDAGGFIERIDGGPQGAVLVESSDYEASGQLARVRFGNGVETSYGYDARERMVALAAAGPGGERLIDNEYRFDPASNLTHIIDGRPLASIERSSPRRNTQVFGYDDLHRLTRARYAHFDDLSANLGQIDYAYDAIGNCVLKATPPAGQPGHLNAPGLTLGAMTYGGGASSGRSGREIGDPPGPHALTSTASGRTYAYDANGNMTRRDGAVLSWDLKDQITGYRMGSASASYLYDYADRRVAKRVSTAGRPSDETIYVNQYYEERPGRSPVKFVFSGPARVARVEGAVDPARPRLQRLRLASGWNAVAAAVGSEKTLAEAFGADAAFYTWRNGAYERLPAARSVQPGEPLWVHVPSARLALLKGLYDPPAADTAVPPGGAMVAWPRLEPFVPETHLSAAARAFVHDAGAVRWRLRDPSLPAFLQDLGAALPSAGALWIGAPAGTVLRHRARKDQEIRFYHPDHLGSSSVTTDRRGALVEEIAYYPFGELRHRHLAAGAAPAEYDFTGKETDDESGLVYHGARFYDPAAGRFLSVDPLIGNPAALEAEKLGELLASPQKLGVYTYVLNNPVRYFDPDGLEEKNSRLMTERSPEEMKAIGSDYATVRRETTTMERKGDWIDIPQGKSVKDVYPKSSWQRVRAEFHVKTFDGKPVSKGYLELTIVGDDGITRIRTHTNERGKASFEMNVPRNGGQMRVTSTFKRGDEVRAATRDYMHVGRKSGQNKLRFDVVAPPKQTIQVNDRPPVEVPGELEVTRTR
jgi:RHS repeat-associated protein